MESAWLKTPTVEGPGSPMWLDLYWLGQSGGSIPISITYIMLWCLYHPIYTLVSICVLFYIVKLLKEIKDNIYKK